MPLSIHAIATAGAARRKCRAARRRRARRGVAAVEFGILAPLLMLFVLAVDFAGVLLCARSPTVPGPLLYASDPQGRRNRPMRASRRGLAGGPANHSPP
jgi:hypothetical protein